MTPSVFRKSRELIGLSQSTLGDRLGLSLRQIRNLETGVSPIKGLHEFALRWIALEECSLNLPYEFQDELNLKR